MTEAPKKIWVDPDYLQDENDCVSTVKVLHRDVEYIRADLVNGLVEALEMCVKHLDADGNLWSKEEQAMALAALKALEVSNGN